MPTASSGVVPAEPILRVDDLHVEFPFDDRTVRAVAAVMDGVGPVSALATEMAGLEAAMADPAQADGMEAIVERYPDAASYRPGDIL